VPGELEVLAPGPLALVQDLGRPGLAHIGVSRSGAADRRAHALANRLVGNPEDFATIEITLGGLSVRVVGGDIEVSVTGADASPAVCAKPFGTNSVRLARVGEIISFGSPAEGLRSYLAVRGGILAPSTLGSRSYDTLSGIGPRSLRVGEVLGIGPQPRRHPSLESAPVAAITNAPLTLRVVPGPRADWFADPDKLVTTDWKISANSDRIGVRLTGVPIEHKWPDRQLPSEGTTRGAIQVPPNGQPVILGPDHPVTGGYPVIGVVVDADTDVLAQARPGQTIWLRWTR
jgi:biotin-dependent carboxylase-like uncharacterized protein